MNACLFDGCTGQASTKGYCPGHYQQQRLGKQMKPLQKQHHGLSEYDRFLAWVSIKGPEECWEWQASCNVKGWHGQFRNAEGVIELAHRVAWRLFKGVIPGGMFVLHKCDNPICVNPSHLFLGTQLDNLEDMWKKGRARPTPSFGEKHGMAKITAEMVREIRDSKESGKSMAAKFQISPTTVCDIRKRRTWNHIE